MRKICLPEEPMAAQFFSRHSVRGEIIILDNGPWETIRLETASVTATPTMERSITRCTWQTCLILHFRACSSPGIISSRRCRIDRLELNAVRVVAGPLPLQRALPGETDSPREGTRPTTSEAAGRRINGRRDANHPGGCERVLLGSVLIEFW